MAERAATILLVEDNEDNRIVYSTILRYAGHRVLEATDGEAGVALARSERPDLILMDVSIPLLDGWEATRILKADPETRHIPIVALTAHALEEDRAKAREVGCDGYIAKPAEPRVVLAQVQEYLARAATTVTPPRAAASGAY
jgi:CheY-like chemotaxis protein